MKMFEIGFFYDFFSDIFKNLITFAKKISFCFLEIFKPIFKNENPKKHRLYPCVPTYSLGLFLLYHFVNSLQKICEGGRGYLTDVFDFFSFSQKLINQICDFVSMKTAGLENSASYAATSELFLIY